MILFIDVPILLTNEIKPNALCLTPTIRPDIWVASSRFLLVVSLGKNTDIPRKGEMWDVSLGWHFKPDEEWNEEYHTPYVLPENVGKSHTKITFREKLYLSRETATKKLSDIMKSAPRFDSPGGFRGAEGSLEALRYERGELVGQLWLTKEAAAKLRKKFGKPAKRNAIRDYLSNLILNDNK